MQRQLLAGGMIDESGRILSAVPGQGAKVHVVSRELERFQKDAATLAKDEADLRVSGRLRLEIAREVGLLLRFN